MHHIPQLPHKTGQAKTGTAKRLKPGRNPLPNFNLLEKQLLKTLQDRASDVPQDMLHDNIKDRQEIDLTKGLRDLMLNEDAHTQNSTVKLSHLIAL